VRPQGLSQEWISILDVNEYSKPIQSLISSEMKNECGFSLLVPYQENVGAFCEARVLEFSSATDMDVETSNSPSSPNTGGKIHVKMEASGTSRWLDLEDCLNLKYCGLGESDSQERLDNILRLCKKVQKRNKAGDDGPKTEISRNDAAEVDDNISGPVRNQEGSRVTRKQAGKVGKKRNVEKDDTSLSQQVKPLYTRKSRLCSSVFLCCPLRKSPS
jgi:hypothetical protein